jgi:hypothetical protein
MNPFILTIPRRGGILAIACALAVLAGATLLAASTTNAAPDSATAAAATTSTATVKAAAPTKDDDDGADDDTKGHSHGAHFEFHTEPSDTFMADLIPLVAIVATFGMPVLIVALVFYFRHRQRSETLALAREFLAKGQPVPPELLASAGRGLDNSPRGAACDRRKGFKLTFIGLGIAAAFYINDPHGNEWGWGLIPMIIGIGFLFSAWVQRGDAPANPAPPANRPPFNPPPA